MAGSDEHGGTMVVAPRDTAAAVPNAVCWFEIRSLGRQLSPNTAPWLPGPGTAPSAPLIAACRRNGAGGSTMCSVASFRNLVMRTSLSAGEKAVRCGAEWPNQA